MCHHWKFYFSNSIQTSSVKMFYFKEKLHGTNKTYAFTYVYNFIKKTLFLYTFICFGFINAVRECLSVSVSMCVCLFILFIFLFFFSFFCISFEVNFWTNIFIYQNWFFFKFLVITEFDSYIDIKGILCMDKFDQKIKVSLS